MNSQRQEDGGLINMAAFLAKSRANGPGLRAVVWVQGCPRRCEDCFNQDMLEFRDNEWLPAAELAARILAVREIDGVTFSGGEPFAQAAALAGLAEQLQAAGLTVVIFTGYTYADLTAANNPDWNRLLAAADVLVAGPYKKDLPSQDYLLGSANQELIYLTDRLKNHPDRHSSQGHTLEFTVDLAGNIVTTGFK
ncbi:4Fe-4S single cluster domain-containing protein [Sporomusa sphaeroides]|jgi:anaerobic ribonucleoside-triphosphate reductase activating protein|uniref:Anaerobic ribonucleoside-triphosphate reductase-activating protein n=1 Tax=Sporomusa sphaeroides DSM 2875 TaxID=1337886 RepID=A0ABP2C3N5_9FIRM|nr:4Fe-4S single cluster domain-containing protein [Sporomusa sphaeroides]OLS56607.1 pyruvate formate-lyase 1-activating enzyme [Sporomusa sphaeroides DSM 2875]CVK19025.1 anaerobic ribonucleotide reductase-activating protein [Sporomusa sphaeroides DSM 2875]HML32603.1 4Fe-4S single cluster domain-containing protein [Sporomusa sphaeroides]